MRLTNWFPPGINPVREGEYGVVDDRHHDMRRWWNGALWSMAYRDCWPEREKPPYRGSPAPFFRQGLVTWRGLADDPSGCRPPEPRTAR